MLNARNLNIHRFLLCVVTIVIAIPMPGVFGQADSSQGKNSKLAQLKFDPYMNLIIVKARINGSENVNLLIDTGASTSLVLETEIAKRLKLKLGPPLNVGQTSQGSQLSAHFVSGVSVKLGDYNTKLSRVLVAPCLGHARRLIGKEVHGILGHRFLTTIAMEVDYENQVLVLHDKNRFQYRGKGESFDLVFDPKIGFLPFTTLELQSKQGKSRKIKMLVDSGGSTNNTGGLGLAQDIKALVATDAKRIPITGVSGLGNSSQETQHSSYLTRLHRMKLGSFVLERPIMTCGKTHNFNLFGAEVLRRFKVVFDYSRKRMILEPNRSFKTPLAYDSSGMMLVASEQDTRVRSIMYVTPKSPAAAAGLRAGDIIVEINGKPADSQSLQATRELFYEPGKKHRLQVKRSGRVFEVTLQTKKLL